MGIRFCTGTVTITCPHYVHSRRHPTRYETIAWIPNVVGMIVMAAVGTKSLTTLPLGDPNPVSAASIMTFAAALAAGIIGWSPIVPDYGIFHDYKARG